MLRAEIPGVDGKDIDIHVTREAVAISGEHRFEKKTQEKGFFLRVPLRQFPACDSPASADPERAGKGWVQEWSPDIDAAQGNGSVAQSSNSTWQIALML